MLDCSDFEGVSCCQSCHEDESYGYDLIELYDSAGKVIGRVCCSVWLNYFDGLPDREQELLAEEKARAKGGPPA